MSLIDCAILPEVQVMMEANFADSRVNSDLMPNSEAAIALIENTTANFSDLTGQKDKEITMNWLNYCDADVQDCTTDCDVTPVAQIAAHCENYSLTICKETKGFFVDETDLRNKKYETKELIAKGLAKDAKALDEFWAQQSVTAVDSFAGVNVAEVAGLTVSGTDTLVPAAMWSPSLMGAFALTAKLNKFSTPYLLSGQNLYLANWNAGMNVGDQAAGDQKRIAVMKMYSDVFNVDSVNNGEKKTYMIQKGSIAFVTKSYYSANTFANPFKAPLDHLIWSMPSPTLPGVTYDVHYAYTCVNGHYIHSFKLKTKGDIFENPLGCDATNTGVISFKCN